MPGTKNITCNKCACMCACAHICNDAHKNAPQDTAFITASTTLVYLQDAIQCKTSPFLQRFLLFLTLALQTFISVTEIESCQIHRCHITQQTWSHVQTWSVTCATIIKVLPRKLRRRMNQSYVDNQRNGETIGHH